MLLDGRPKSTIIAYTRSVRDLMEDIGKVPLEVHRRAPIRKAVHPYALRHTFAVHYRK